MTLTLTARDSSGLECSTSVDVYPSPNEPPSRSIDSPAPGAGSRPPKSLGFSGQATDREDGDAARVGPQLAI